LQDINLTLNAGEVIGVAGVEGNGQSELFAVLAGEQQPESGEVQRSHAEITLALVPQDRHHEGLSLDLPVSHNLLYPDIMQGAYRRFGLLNHAAIAVRANEMIDQSDIRTHSHASPARSLSAVINENCGGTGHGAAASIIVVYQPTRGLDIAAAEAVLMRLAEAADAGTTVLIISSNIEELIRVSDRIVVMNGGRITGEVTGEAMKIERIGTLMTSGRSEQKQAAGGVHV
jgi:ABC-type uncharacterized transport systems, ATPase components